MSCVQTVESEGIRLLRLDRPPVNAVELELVADLEASLEEAARDEACRAVVLTGAGNAFSAGIDVKVVPPYDRGRRGEMIRRVNRAVERLYGLPKPVVAAVNGHALGGGLVIALACDRRLLAAGSCQLGLTEVVAGIPFPAGPLVVVRAELPAAVARSLVLTGPVFTPADPLAAAVFDEVVPPERLLPMACEWAAAASRLPAYGRVKRQLRSVALARLREIVERGDDPMLAAWM